jgi:hypothetical protein
VSDDQQSEFRSLSEFYIIIFLNKLKIVENIPPPKKKAYGKGYVALPSDIHMPLLGYPGPGPMTPLPLS